MVRWLIRPGVKAFGDAGESLVIGNTTTKDSCSSVSRVGGVSRVNKVSRVRRCERCRGVGKSSNSVVVEPEVERVAEKNIRHGVQPMHLRGLEGR
jgi:hypothetical protein